MRAVGQTPLVCVDGIYAKLECTNPCGSIKDRIVCYILDKSEERGLLKPGQRIVEATSGNTGIAYAYYAKQRGYPITIVMPEDMTEERKRILREFGAELVLAGPSDFAGAAKIRDGLAREHGWFNPDQFSNPLNTECHYNTTGREILDQLREPIDAFVAGVGTGGTLMGAGKRIRDAWPDARLVAVEPAESAVMTGGPVGQHGIGGIGDGFVPAIASDGAGKKSAEIDGVEVVSTEEARQAAASIAERHGFCVGVSSGANYVAATRLRAKGARTVVTVFADGYAKYVSLGLTHCDARHCPYEHKPVIGEPGTAI
ncbi:MAG: PLP-dependent cysteine synthase family protein [Polyangiales bacterium]